MALDFFKKPLHARKFGLNSLFFHIHMDIREIPPLLYVGMGVGGGDTPSWSQSLSPPLWPAFMQYHLLVPWLVKRLFWCPSWWLFDRYSPFLPPGTQIPPIPPKKAKNCPPPPPPAQFYPLPTANHCPSMPPHVMAKKPRNFPYVQLLIPTRSFPAVKSTIESFPHILAK